MDKVEIFHNPSIYTPETHSTSANESEQLVNDLTIDGVRITPGYMHFDDAYEGKRFRQKLVIQNCGSHSAFIRLGHPNSMSFVFRSFPDGRYLSPGLKIVRTLTYVHRGSIAVKRGYAPININDKLIDYHFFVSLSAAVLSLEPEKLDFGRIDAVNVATTRTLYIKNSGSKGTQFAIDLGRNELELIVDPMKGNVPAKSKIPLRVELVGSKEGVFMERFWVKCVPPLRAIVTGVFITPKLLVRSFISSLDFTLMHFGPTYYGSRATKPLLIKNSSPSHSMYCVLGEVKGSAVPLVEAEKLDENFTNFSLTPTDGRMAAEKGSVIQITFSPVRGRKDKGYAACFMKVIRLDCRDVYHHEYAETFLREDQKSRDTTVSTMSSMSLEKLWAVDEDDNQDVVTTVGSNHSTSHITFQQAIGVCLYGEKESPNILLRPNLIDLKELHINESYDRELYVENMSKRLPITLKYCKVASINVEPKEFNLNPRENKEIKIAIKCIQLGDISKKICFDLLALDYPNSMGIMRKVGSISLKITYSVDSVVKKRKFKKSQAHHDLSLKLPSDFPFRQTPSRTITKMNNDNFYLDYIRKSRENREAGLPKRIIEHYDLTNPKFLFREDLKCECPPPRKDVIVPYSSFISLTPQQLYNIRIIPKSMKLKKVAPFTVISDDFHIHNRNSFPIRVFLSSSKPCIVFDNAGRYVIAADENKKIRFFFSSFTVGRYYVSMNVLVNYSCVFEVTAVAVVVPKTIKLESQEIDFSEVDGHYKFIDLTNNLNSFTNFDWDVPDSCFKIYPSEGRIKSERFLTSAIVYTPRMGQPSVTDCTLVSESGHTKIVQLSFKRKRPSISFDCELLDFGEVPLNIPVRKVIIMRNLKDFKTLYSIANVNPIPGVTVEPSEGMLDEKDSEVFFVTVHLQAVIDFTTEIIFSLDEETEMKVGVQGSVNFPKCILTPSNLYFTKIAPRSFDMLPFRVKNSSNCEFYMTFPIEDFPEFSVTQHEDIPLPHLGKLVLQPGDLKELYLHFHPNHVTTNVFDLPYQINDILGPPTTNNKVKFFLMEEEEKYVDVDGITIASNIPKNLPLIRINSCAVDKVLKFLHLTTNFVYFGPNHYANKTSEDFTIINTSSETVKVCIRTDDLCSPFFLTLKSDQEIVYYDLSFVMTLEPGEHIVFEASFEPYDYGEYSIKLPIFLRHYQDNKIFNYLTLNGVYEKPSIKTSRNDYHFEPVPVRLKNEIRITLFMKNHFEKCEVYTKTNLHGLYPIFESGRCPKIGKSTLIVLLTYDSMTCTCFNSYLEFYCTCESSHTINVTGVVEDCLLTTHALLFLLTEEEDPNKSVGGNETFIIKLNSVSNKNTTTYPRFPSDDDESVYACYMRNVRRTLENYIYTQGFYSKQYYKIPDGFIYYSRTTVDMKKKWQKKPSAINDPPLLELIMNLAGPEVRGKLAPCQSDSHEEVDILANTCQTYHNILNYLKELDNYLPHVRVEYLLNYQQYCLFEKLKKQQYVPSLSESMFYAYSTQCWVDLILQIIKSFYYKRMVESADNESILSEPIMKAGRTLSMVSDVSTDFDPFLNIQFYGCQERTLLTWLDLCYDNERDSLWPNEPARKKEVTCFNTDLRDGLVLGAVTVRYCPYVKHMIKHMFTNVVNPEDSFHNICILVKTWKMLNLSYKVDPLTFEQCSEVEMALLVTYLYDVLPNCYPQNTITIKASLTQCEKTPMELQNLGTSPISFKVLFFGNDNGLFRVITKNKDDPTIVVEAGRTKRVMVEYYAKCVMEARAVILFSGETPGRKYGKNIAVEVEGKADMSYICAEIPVTVNLYKTCEINVNIESPFKKKAAYTPCIGYEGQEGLYTWEEIAKLKMSKEFIFTEEAVVFDEDGSHTLKMTACCQVPGSRNIWVYFTNPEVGDWGIRLKLTGKLTADNYEQITILLPDNYDNLVCRCKSGIDLTKNCPKIIRIALPKQNRLLWHARKQMVLEYVQGSELQFWEKHIYTPVGTRVLALIFSSETHPLRHIVDESVEYEVILANKSPFVTVDSVIIDDCNSEDDFELPIHPVGDLKGSKTVIVQLATKVNQEKRFYKFFFKEKNLKGTRSMSQQRSKTVEINEEI